MKAEIHELSIADLYASLEFIKIQKKDLSIYIKSQRKDPDHNYTLDSLSKLEFELYTVLFKKVMSLQSKD